MPLWADKIMWNKFKNKTYHLLRWSEKYTKTDMVYLTKGGFWLTTGKIISAIVGFILLIIYANFLPKETFGNFQYILSIIGLLYIFNLPGLDTSLTKSINKMELNSWNYMSRHRYILLLAGQLFTWSTFTNLWIIYTIPGFFYCL
jgi:O-antigen/teichoic acid export membrane protein